MELKSVNSANVTFDNNGMIVIEQISESLEKVVAIYLTLSQIQEIDMWAYKNKEEIEAAWNSGIL